jgi:Nitrile hydratase beta subunit
MRHVHDRGGWPDAGPIERAEHDYAMWEKRTDAMLRILTRDQHIIRVDELRRAIESISPKDYETMSYYERWITAIEALIIEKGLLSREDIDRRVETIAATRHV